MNFSQSKRRISKLREAALQHQKWSSAHSSAQSLTYLLVRCLILGPAILLLTLISSSSSKMARTTFATIGIIVTCNGIICYLQKKFFEIEAGRALENLTRAERNARVDRREEDRMNTSQGAI